MRLRLPRSLHYPITITDLLKQPGDEVDRLEPLFSYFYKTTVTEGDPLGEHQEVDKTFPARYESPVEGKLTAWKIKRGAVITSHDVEVAEIEEPCSHSVQFAGMCTMCGKDMTMLNYNTDISYADRATINMVHDNTALTISQDEASRLEEEAKRRLLHSRKLSLVVDLDQTIIHATVDPTVAEWQQDKDNPNHEAVKEVQAFQLVDDGPGMRGCWYYIKLRPGLKDFLENVSRLYELHVYTMGTRAYAQNIARIVDPDRRIFGDRILSRDESGSLTAKSLQRLFPVDTKMVVIIDDRGDVWHWSENLVKVTPYDFFVGIGDINSSFLPKKPDLQKGPRLRLTAPKPNNDLAEGATIREPEPDVAHPLGDASALAEAGEADSETSATSDASTLDRLVSMSGGSDPATLQRQASKQDEALTAQLEDRPLLQKQKQLDAEDEAAAAAEQGGDDSNSNSSNKDDEDGSSEPATAAAATTTESARPHQRQNLLHDDDTELRYLEKNLREVHKVFFDEYDRRLTQARGGRLAALRGDKPSRKLPIRGDDNADLELVPDVKTIMPQMKTNVLDGVVLVFSGVVPLGTDIQRSDIALWAKSFGAHVAERVTRRTTHLVAGRPRTAKVRQAARRRPRVNIVSPLWLLHSISQWQWLDEEPYMIPVDPEDRDPAGSGAGAAGGAGSNEDNGGILSSSDDVGGDDDDGDGDGDGNGNGVGNGDDMAVETKDGDDEEEQENTEMMDDDDPEGVRPAELEGNVSPIEGFFNNYSFKEVDTELAEFLASDDDDDDGENNAGGDDNDNESVQSTSSQTNSNTTTTAAAAAPSSAATTTRGISVSVVIEKRKRKRSRSTTPVEGGHDDRPPSRSNDNKPSSSSSPSSNTINPSSSSSSSSSSSNTTNPTSTDPAAASSSASQQSTTSTAGDPAGSRLSKRQRQARERTTGLKTVALAADDRGAAAAAAATAAEAEAQFPPTPEITGPEDEDWIDEEEDKEDRKKVDGVGGARGEGGGVDGAGGGGSAGGEGGGGGDTEEYDEEDEFTRAFNAEWDAG